MVVFVHKLINTTAIEVFSLSRRPGELEHLILLCAYQPYDTHNKENIVHFCQFI